jgi:hypothetical protein
LTNDKAKVVEVCEENQSGLHFSHIVPTPECAASVYQDQSTPLTSLRDEPSDYDKWHDRAGHPGRDMLKKIANAVKGMSLKQSDLAAHGKKLCHPCAMGKLQNRPKAKLHSQKLKPRGILDTLVSDVCGPISSPSGPFNYYMAVKDTTSRFSKVHLLASRNEVMPKLLTSIIHFKTQFPDHMIRNVRVDNASEYVSRSFQEFCLSSGINLETSVPYAQNTNAENFVKQI